MNFVRTVKLSTALTAVMGIGVCAYLIAVAPDAGGGAGPPDDSHQTVAGTTAPAQAGTRTNLHAPGMSKAEQQDPLSDVVVHTPNGYHGPFRPGLLTETGYDWEAHEGLIVAEKLGWRGFLDESGHVAIPFVYSFAWAFREGLARVSSDEGKGFIDRTGAWVIGPFEGFDAVLDDFSEGLAPFGLRTAWKRAGEGRVGVYVHGFIDKNARIVIQPAYERVRRFREGRAAVKRDGLWGFIDRSGGVVVEPRFMSVGGFSEGLACVEVDGLWGFIDVEGTMAIAPQFAAAHWFHDGRARVGFGGVNPPVMIDHFGNRMPDELAEGIGWARIPDEQNQLWIAVMGSDMARVREYVEDGVPVSTRHPATHETLLHQAVAQDDPQMIACLIELGCDVNAKDVAGQTPLHYVARDPQANTPIERIVEILVSAGADLNAADNNGRIPWDIAEAAIAKYAEEEARYKRGGKLLSATNRKYQERVLKAFEKASAARDR